MGNCCNTKINEVNNNASGKGLLAGSYDNSLLIPGSYWNTDLQIENQENIQVQNQSHEQKHNLIEKKKNSIEKNYEELGKKFSALEQKKNSIERKHEEFDKNSEMLKKQIELQEKLNKKQKEINELKQELQNQKLQIEKNIQVQPQVRVRDSIEIENANKIDGNKIDDYKKLANILGKYIKNLNHKLDKSVYNNDYQSTVDPLSKRIEALLMRIQDLLNKISQNKKAYVPYSYYRFLVFMRKFY